MKVFFSGSREVLYLPEEAKKLLSEFMKEGHEILVGDAKGVDSLVQEYCSKNNYFKVTVYSIYEKPRFLASEKFNVKHIKLPDYYRGATERERQTVKDATATSDCDFAVAIWNGKSKGTLENIKRLEKYKKKYYLIKV